MKDRDSTTLAKCGFKNGEMLHVGNKQVALASVAEAAKKEEAKQADSGTSMIDTTGGAG